MKTTITTLAITTILVITACKKEKTNITTNTNGGGNTNTQAYINFKAEGVQYQFNYGSSSLDNEVEQIAFSYTNGSATDMASIYLVFDKAEQLGLKTYSIVENSYNSLSFKKSSTDKNNNEYFLFQNGGPKGNASITITKMKLMPSGGANTYAINGTFEGKLYNKNGASIQITEGEFFNPLTN